MDRLTKRDERDDGVFMDCDRCRRTQKYCSMLACRNRLKDRLAAYEDTGLTPEELMSLKNNEVIPAHWQDMFIAECESRLIVLPCKVGDTVWRVVGSGSKRKVIDNEIEKIEIHRSGVEICIGWRNTGYEHFDIEYIGEKIFLTHEEAEAALGRKV